MTCRGKRFFAALLALALVFTLVRQEGTAVLENVYFTAVNDKLMPLNDETMPFWSNNTLYVCYTVFDQTDLDVQYIRNYSMGLAVLYTSKNGLYFDLVGRTVYDKNDVFYSGNAIEKNGYVFFPLDLVCRYFGLSWSQSDTATVPLIRVKSDTVVLDDRGFIGAAATMMASRYAEYEKIVNAAQQEEDEKPPNEPDEEPVVSPPPIHAADGQKLYLVLSGRTEEAIRSAMNILTDRGATFILTAQQMENGELIREILGSGHSIALLVPGGTESEILTELQRARELVWMAACSLLQLVWYEGIEDATPLFEEQGCVSITAQLDRRTAATRSVKEVDALMRTIGKHQKDLSIYLGNDEKYLDGLSTLLERLDQAQYRLCAWRLTHGA